MDLGRALRLPLGDKTVESILKKAAEAKLKRRKDNPIRVVRVGIDEISNKKGHGGYVLVLTDLDQRILLDILPDRSKKGLKVAKEPTERNNTRGQSENSSL